MSSPTSLPTIFVSIPAYRDAQCAYTVEDCFAKADNPERVYVGVYEQVNADDNLDCKRRCSANNLDHVRVITEDASCAKGPVYARSVIETRLFGGEDYVLGIDSHTVFSSGWDTQCILQLEMCNSDKPVLSCYPSEYNIVTRDEALPSQPPQFLKFRDFHEKRCIPQQDRVQCYEQPSRPLPSALWGACFSFSKSLIYLECPVDPNYHYVFLGEEISMAARLYTHGWDVFSPVTNLVLHYTPRDYRPTFWEQIYKINGVSAVNHATRAARRRLETQGNLRVKSLLNCPLNRDEQSEYAESIPHIEPKYALGTVRTLGDFEDFSGIYFNSMTHARHARWGLVRDASVDDQMCKFGRVILQA